MEASNEVLPSGKQITRQFDDDGRLMSETHMYGLLDFAIKRSIEADGTVEEYYFKKRRVISRERYEKLRLEYPDMPSADSSVEDVSGSLAKGAAKEQRDRRKSAKAHQPDPARAKQNDEFCRNLLAKGCREDAGTWLSKGRNNLGELTPTASTRLVSMLLKLGCAAVHACDIDESEEGGNTGHLILELPITSDKRPAIFKALAKLAGEEGYLGDFDDGQRYAYVKLD